MSEGFKPKKSVALSGVVAGNTELCTVGRSGNDLHYRGYDIADLAEACEFEEVAHLLVHGHLPSATELAAYKTKLRALRGLPVAVLQVLETLPAAAHPMDRPSDELCTIRGQRTYAYVKNPGWTK